MKKVIFDDAILIIENALRESGYDPYTQIYGYLKTGNDSYITRKDNARLLISQLDKDLIAEYLTKYKQ